MTFVAGVMGTGRSRGIRSVAVKKDTTHSCALCGTEDLGHKYYCYGCKAYVCSHHPLDPEGVHCKWDHDPLKEKK